MYKTLVLYVMRLEAQRKHMVIPWGKKLFEMWVMRKILTAAAKILFFFNQSSRDILFSCLVSLFLSFVFVFACFFFEIKNIYSDIHSTMQAGE